MPPRKKKTAKKTATSKAPAKRGRKPKEETEATETAAPKKKRKAVKSAAKKTEAATEPPEPAPTASGHKDPNVGRDGFSACCACGWWGPNGATLCHHCGMPRSGRPLSPEEKAAREAGKTEPVPVPPGTREGEEPEEPEETEVEDEGEPDPEPEYYKITLSVTAPLHDALVELAEAAGKTVEDILVRAVELGAIQMRDSGEMTDLPEKEELAYDDAEDPDFLEAFEAAARTG